MHDIELSHTTARAVRTVGHPVDGNSNNISTGNNNGVSYVIAPVAESYIHPSLLQHQPTLISATAPPSSSSNDYTNSNLSDFSSNVCNDCLGDEEVCWWSFWCCWMVQARTVESLNIGTTKSVIMSFWAVILSFLFFYLFVSKPIGILIGIVGGIYLYYTRADSRTKIRQKLSIRGSTCDDYLYHFFCPFCSVCQESRESKVRNFKRLDYCSGEELDHIRLLHENVLNNQLLSAHTGSPTGSPNGSSSAHSDYGDIHMHMKALSKTSHLILKLCGVVAILCIVILLLTKHVASLFVLLLVFVQPVAILYFVYWKNRRQYAILDMVIKCFAVGFWFTTFQSMILELVLQFMLGLVFLPIVGTSVTSIGSYTDDGDNSSSNGSDGSSSSSRSIVKKGLIDIMFKYFQLSTSSSSFGDNGYQSNAYLSSGDESAAEKVAHNQELLRDHFPIVMVALFMMAFVVAAGVEETMKHFVVRCCQFPVPLREPNAILVYLMAGALGFATSENIEYVFSTVASPIPGTSMIIGEILVLLLRVLMPIHVICSVLQATQLCKSFIGNQNLSLLMILLPAVCLHGTYDFVLFAISAYEFAYNKDSFNLEVITFAISIAITVGGAVIAYKSFQSVLRDSHGWVSLNSSDTVYNDNVL